VVQHLIDTKRINALLARLIMNLELEEAALEVTADWHSWIAENLRLGSAPDELGGNPRTPRLFSRQQYRCRRW
jgi:hypothetical protein